MNFVVSRICRASGVAVLIALFSNCSEPVGPGSSGIRFQLGTLQLTPIDSVGATISILDMNDAGVVVGNLTANGTTQGFTWKAGKFTVLQSAGGPFTAAAINDFGDVAGLVNGVPFVWQAGNANPTPMFRSDTTLAPFFLIKGINTRGEVLFSPTTTVFSEWVWKAGVQKPLKWPVTSCSSIRINNQGVILGTLCGEMYVEWRLVDSPFGVMRVNSGKLAGQTCAANTSGHGVVDGAVAVNDSNEVLESAHWQTGIGCRTFSTSLTAFNARGLIASYTGSLSSQRATLMTERDSVDIDGLLNVQTAAAWQVQVVSRITNSGQMWARAVRLSDGRVVPVFLSPSAQ